MPPSAELPLDITNVRVVASYVLELTFENGERRLIDVETYLWGPAFRLLADDYAVFCQVRVDPLAGTVMWPTGADLSPGLLYAESTALD